MLDLAVVRRLAALYGRTVADVASAARCAAPRHLVAGPTGDSETHLLLAEALAWSGRTCVDLAAAVGVSPCTVQRWRRGEQRPTAAHARASEDALTLPRGSLVREVAPQGLGRMSMRSAPPSVLAPMV
jgi:transcriptional regulator with XRE-family HTH domain